MEADSSDAPAIHGVRSMYALKLHNKHLSEKELTCGSEREEIHRRPRVD